MLQPNAPKPTPIIRLFGVTAEGTPSSVWQSGEATRLGLRRGVEVETYEHVSPTDGVHCSYSAATPLQTPSQPSCTAREIRLQTTAGVPVERGCRRCRVLRVFYLHAI